MFIKVKFNFDLHKDVFHLFYMKTKIRTDLIKRFIASWSPDAYIGSLSLTGYFNLYLLIHFTTL